MDAARRRGAATLLAIAVAAWGLDRLTKIWAESTLPGAPIDVIDGVLRFRFTTNPGGAFSIGGSASWVFVSASFLVVALILVTAFRHRSAATAAAVGLVLGGALGNLTDRLLRGPRFGGRVVDFIDFHVWPVFNLADAAIVVGAILIAASSFREDRERDEVDGSPSDAPIADAGAPAPRASEDGVDG